MRSFVFANVQYFNVNVQHRLRIRTKLKNTVMNLDICKQTTANGHDTLKYTTFRLEYLAYWSYVIVSFYYGIYVLSFEKAIELQFRLNLRYRF